MPVNVSAPQGSREPLPFSDLTSAAPRRDGGAQDFAYDKPPTWLRASVSSCEEACEPLGGPALAADEYFDNLVRWISVEDRVTQRTRAWADQARARIAACLRPQLGDVDVMLTGSLAHGTHIATAPLDVDLVVRVYEGRRTWHGASATVLKDLGRWLEHGLEAPVTRGTHGVVISSPGGADVEVVPFWRRDEDATGFESPWSTDGETYGDPMAHCSRLAARNAALGANSCLLRLVRIVKHLNHRAARVSGTPVMSSFHLEALALRACHRPFRLAEGVADFLREAADLAASAPPDAFSPFGLVGAADRAAASAFLSDAAAVCDEGLFATDSVTAADVLSRLFGRPETSA